MYRNISKIKLRIYKTFKTTNYSSNRLSGSDIIKSRRQGHQIKIKSRIKRSKGVREAVDKRVAPETNNVHIIVDHLSI